MLEHTMFASEITSKISDLRELHISEMAGLIRAIDQEDVTLAIDCYAEMHSTRSSLLSAIAEKTRDEDPYGDWLLMVSKEFDRREDESRQYLFYFLNKNGLVTTEEPLEDLILRSRDESVIIESREAQAVHAFEEWKKANYKADSSETDD